MAEPKPRRRWYQYSLRTLLLLVLLASIGMSYLGVKMRQARRQRAAVEALVELGATVAYVHDLINTEPPGPVWLRKLLGDDVFADVVVKLADTETGDDDLKHLGALPRLDTLNLCRTNVTDAGLEHIEGSTVLFALFLSGTSVTDAGLERLRGLTGLRCLDLSETAITDVGAKHVAAIRGIDSLQLHHTAITDAGLEHLLALTGLEYLDLRETRVTIAGLNRLKGLKSLNILAVSPSNVTYREYEALQKALPNTDVQWY